MLNGCLIHDILVISCQEIRFLGLYVYLTHKFKMDFQIDIRFLIVKKEIPLPLRYL